MRTYFSAKIVCLLIVTLFSFKSTFACEGSIPPVCEAFGQSKNVFVGKLIKLEKIKVYGSDELNAEFQVSKIYKGKVNETHFVKFSISDCGITLVEGETYLVYEDQESLWAYNRTNQLKYLRNDIDYIESLSKEIPQYIIYGQIQKYGDIKLDGIKMFIEEKNGNEFQIYFDHEFNFKFKTTKPEEYILKMVIPFNAEVSNGDYYIFYPPEITASPKQTISKTEFKFRPNSCNYLEYIISKSEEK